jgi:hypothetical protein
MMKIILQITSSSCINPFHYGFIFDLTSVGLGLGDDLLVCSPLFEKRGGFPD